MSEVSKTVFHAWHQNAGAKMVPFGGFEMPIQYTSILKEHLATRKKAGLFDISHMGRFLVSGKEALPFLQYTLSNNAYSLREPGMAQYTIIPNEEGGAIDDAYLYRIGIERYMLVANAANRQKDWDWLSQFKERFNCRFENISDEMAMLSLQGPESERVLQALLDKGKLRGRLPDNQKNCLAAVKLGNEEVIFSRTGYTGEPVNFEIFVPVSRALELWADILEEGSEHGVIPVGLGARDTLRLEAGYPLYGHELGLDPEGKDIPIFALSLGRAVTRFEEVKGDFVGRKALWKQYQEVKDVLKNNGRGKPLAERCVKKLIWPLAVLNKEGNGPGIHSPRPGYEVHYQEKCVGWVTSGGPVPSWSFDSAGLLAQQTDEESKRAIAMAYIDSDLHPSEFGENIQIHKQRGKSFYPIPGLLVKTNLRSAAPYSHPVAYPENKRPSTSLPKISGKKLLEDLVEEAISNTAHRQKETINLIPSEQTPSRLVRLLSIMDPVGRYAEHKRIKAFGREAKDVFYYQGTSFIEKVEDALEAFFQDYLGCSVVETKPIAGQLANASVFAGLVDYFNRFQKEERQRMHCVMNNHLRRGGHLSAQVGGALKHFVQRDPQTGLAAVIDYPVEENNPYKIDVDKTLTLIKKYSPSLLILGKSMILHPEPVSELSQALTDMPDRPLIMYDGAHVLGILGPHYQEPLREGADLLTGSTHKTFFGTQRGLIASNMSEDSEMNPLWQKIQNDVFPGSMSNHHLGTMLGLLGACYEMMEFRDSYQKQIIQNAKAFARALQNKGVQVEGDPSVDYTQTHQVILRVDKAKGPEVASRLEESNILVNYQGLPDDSGFSDASGIRLGVQEMTRFGMKEEDFATLADYLAAVIVQKKNVGADVSEFRRNYLQMSYCLEEDKARELAERLVLAYS